jgi:hypothetical protein
MRSSCNLEGDSDQRRRRNDPPIAYRTAGVPALFLHRDHRGRGYTRVTPHNEFQLIRDDDPAAAIALGLSRPGFSVPVISAIAHAANVVDCLIWRRLQPVLRRRLRPFIVGSDIRQRYARRLRLVRTRIRLWRRLKVQARCRENTSFRLSGRGMKDDIRLAGTLV